MVLAGFCLAERLAFPHFANSEQDYSPQVLPSLGEVSFSAFFVLSKTLLIAASVVHKTKKVQFKIKIYLILPETL